MTQTLSINLGGILFHIDESAYKMLQSYLKKVEKQFDGDPDKRELMADIESRIAELLDERIKRDINLVNEEHVQQVIEIMGNPEDFSGDEEPYAESTKKEEKFKNRQATRRMYRDSEQRIIGGVCAGLGAYFGTNPWIFRALFIVLTLFALSGGVIYLILWITIPEAITTAQKLEMQGKPIDIENIKNTVKEEFSRVRQRMNF